LVTLVEFGSDGWMLIARRGTKLGWVPSDLVHKIED
jgi:hypothetical protein